MKKLLLSVVLVLGLLGAVPPALAQDGGCTQDLSQVYLLMGEAQGAWERGDSGAALAALAQARQALIAIELACGGGQDLFTPTPSPTPMPTETPTPRPDPDRVIVFAARSMMESEPFTKLIAFGFANNAVITVYDNQRDFLVALEAPDVVGAIYAGPAATTEGMRDLNDFVSRGGRILLMYDQSWLALTTIAQDLFGISLAEDTFATQTNADFLYPAEMLPPWLRGMEIGINGAGGTVSAAFQAFVVVPQNWPGERGVLPSDTAGTSELLYYANPTRTIIFWPLPNDTTTGDTLYFFSDTNLSFFDNQQAALEMINLLLGR
ncbi:MAG: hypothetical protein GXY36_01590 [Chloroflexi bacterium]|nr:hypothetical protein [Chloroflexota bacterium]